ncbi:MAG: hypothetical protein R8G66_17875 [Cytophagales bacterium]|nr:hypothetical protein [Cytophagales bacterium]
MLKTIVVLWVVLCATQALVAQNSNQNLLPNVTGPSPEVAQLGKFGSYDVNYFTGTASIELPIHTIVAKDIQIPIVLRYHPSGIKVTDRPGWVGLGWSMDAGGFISRQVLGLPDELQQGYANTALPASLNPAVNADLHYLNDVNRGLIDAEPDVFSYGFGGYSGKFMLDPLQNSPDANNTVGGTGGPYFNAHRIAEAEQGCDDDDVMMIPYRPLDIQPTYGTSSVTFKAFDPYGREYQFDKYETTKEVNESLNVRSAWKLTKVISKNKTTEVSFDYHTRSGQVSKDRSYSIMVNDLVQNLPGGSTYTANPGVYNSQDHNMHSTEQYLETITYPLGKVEFIRSGVREGGFTGQQMLDEIRIYQTVGGTDVLIKKIDFDYGTFTSTDGTGAKRSYLKDLFVKSSSGVSVQKYHFDYNTSQMLPDFLSTKRDLWGYYNNQSNARFGIATLVPKHSINYQAVHNGSSTTIEIGSENSNGRAPNSLFAQANILNKITYPTGGYTQFIYEGNSYLDGTTSVAGPGLRIKEIHTYESSTATPIKRSFEYGDGRANFLNEHYTFDSEVNHRTIDAHSQAICCTMRSRTYLSSPNIALEPFDQALVVYPQVTVYEGTSTANIGKSIYDYWDYNDTPGPGFQIGTPSVESNHWRRGKLKQMRAYRYDGGANPYTLVQEQNHTYGGFGLCQMGNVGLKVKKLFINGGDALWEGGTNNDVNSFQFAYYRVLRGDDMLLSTEEINYSETDTAYTVLTEYFYDSYAHQQLTFTKTTSSKGEALSKELYYPGEVSGTVYTDMVTNHQIAYPVIETSLRDSIEVQKLVRNYSEPGTDIFEPSTITTQRAGGTIFTEATFHSYDSYGNPTSFTGRDGVQKSVLWSHDGQYAAVVGENIDFISLQVAVGFSLPSGYNSLQELMDQMGEIATNASAQADWQAFNNTLRSQTTLAAAFIQTFTYDPAIGQTSATGATGLTSYYRYDNHNRLYQVKDFQGNVLEEHLYNFKNN